MDDVKGKGALHGPMNERQVHEYGTPVIVRQPTRTRSKQASATAERNPILQYSCRMVNVFILGLGSPDDGDYKFILCLVVCLSVGRTIY